MQDVIRALAEERREVRMRKILCTVSLASLLGSAGAITAQSTTQPRPESTPTAKEETKLTGCLKEAPASTGSTSETSSVKKFILEVMPPHAGMPSTNRSPEAPRETPDQTTRAGEKETYGLMAMGGVDLSKHVNHVVELTGAKAEMSATASAAGERPMFHVTVLRMVSTNCNQTSQ
jgi:hypothetical protein